MRTDEIERLVELYDNGETSEKEEMELFRFFSEADVPAHLQADKEYFMQLKRVREVQIPQSLEPLFDDRRLGCEGKTIRTVEKDVPFHSLAMDVGHSSRTPNSIWSGGLSVSKAGSVLSGERYLCHSRGCLSRNPKSITSFFLGFKQRLPKDGNDTSDH